MSLRSGLAHPPRLMLLPRPLAPARQDGVSLSCRQSATISGIQFGMHICTRTGNRPRLQMVRALTPVQPGRELCMAKARHCDAWHKPDKRSNSDLSITGCDLAKPGNRWRFCLNPKCALPSLLGACCGRQRPKWRPSWLSTCWRGQPHLRAAPALCLLPSRRQSLPPHRRQQKPWQ